jgi:carboxyl-terminal processing protease
MMWFKSFCPPTFSPIRSFGRLIVLLLLLSLCSVTQAQPRNDWLNAAYHGDFNTIRLSLEQDQNLQANPDLQSLLDELKIYQQHEKQFAAKRQTELATALKKMHASLAIGRVEEALINAIEAQSQVDDPEKFLENAEIKKLVTDAEIHAGKTELEGNWLTALSLYRKLEMLFEPIPRYKTHIERINQRVRVISLYAPKKIAELYKVRAKSVGDETEPPPVALEAETWQKRLTDVNLPILTSALRNSAMQHYSGVGYRELMLSSVKSLKATVLTPGLEEAFPSLTNQALHNDFVNYLSIVQNNLRQRRDRMTNSDVATTLQRIFDQNEKTLKLPQEVIIYELTEGAMSQLDPFSAVIWPYEVDQFNRSTSGMFFGVGVQIALTNNQLTVVSPLPDSPAHHAGIKPGDIIVQVNGQATTNWTLDWAVKEITGPAGSHVVLGVQRKGANDLLTFDLQRSKIQINSVRGWQRDDKTATGWDYYIDPENKIGYIRVSQFIPRTPTDFDRAINQMETEHGINGLILDLRFNPGGLMRRSVDLVNRFVSNGTLLSTVDSADRTTSLYPAKAHLAHYPRIPLVVMINQGSASAAEIVAGALQDHQAGILVGSRSFGKGSVQDVYPMLGNRAQMKITTLHYKLPLGRIIHREPGAHQWGVDPDVPVKMTDQEVADAIEYRREVDVVREDGQGPKPDKLVKEGLDLQLEAALLLARVQSIVEEQNNLAKRRDPFDTP